MSQWAALVKRVCIWMILCGTMAYAVADDVTIKHLLSLSSRRLQRVVGGAQRHSAGLPRRLLGLPSLA